MRFMKPRQTVNYLLLLLYNLEAVERILVSSDSADDSGLLTYTGT